MPAKSLLAISIYDSIIVVYSHGSGVVPKVSLKHKMCVLPMIVIYVDAIYEFDWNCIYVVSWFILPIKMCFVGSLCHMDATICKTSSRKSI